MSSLGRRPVKQGLDGAENYLYRGEVVNNAIKMAGGEVNLFRDKAEVTHKMDFSDLSDEELLLRLPSRPGRRLVEEWLGFVEAGAAEALAAALIEQHYDPAYRRSSRRQPHERLGAIALPKLDAADFERAAAEIAGLVERKSQAAA